MEGHTGLSNHTSTDPYGQGLGQDPRLGQRGTNSSSNPRPHSSMSGKLGARSWHASPWQSDDETDQEHHFFKEEKKNRIKMEISRRRHQIEENARLHEELIRLAKLRENAELGTMDYNLSSNNENLVFQLLPSCQLLPTLPNISNDNNKLSSIFISQVKSVNSSRVSKSKVSW